MASLDQSVAATPPVDDRRPERPGSGVRPVAFLVVVALLAGALPFGMSQSIWSDETTQMAGLRLGPVEVARWLMGENAERFGVPPDRMPPLSYWAGWLWSRAFGLSERSLRALSLSVTACAAVSVVAAAGRLGGARSAALAGLLFATSPNVVGMAGEIRAYPFLMACAGLAFLCLIGRVQSPPGGGGGWLACLVIASLMAAYSHFYGLVLGGAVLSAAFVIGNAQRRPVGPVLVAGAAFLLLASGVIPFAAYSVRLSGQAGPAIASLRPHGSFVRTLYRLVGSPAASVDRPALAALLSGFIALIAMALSPRRPREDHLDPSGSGEARRSIRLDLMAVPVALLAGLLATYLAGKAIGSFDVYTTSYSLWAVPGVCIVGGCGVAPGLGRRASRMATFAATAALLGSAWSDALMVSRGPVFGHSLNRRLVAMMEAESDGRRPLILHDAQGPWGLVYFPLRYTFGDDAAQFRAEPTEGASLERRPLVPLAGATRAITLGDIPPGGRVLVVHAATFGQAELRLAVRGGIEIPAGELIAAMDRSPEWSILRSLSLPAATAAQVRLYQRRAPPSNLEARPPGVH